jgi:hypothetical protein
MKRRYGFSLDPEIAAEAEAYCTVKGIRSVGDLARQSLINAMSRNAPTAAQRARMDKLLQEAGKARDGPEVENHRNGACAVVRSASGGNLGDGLDGLPATP